MVINKASLQEALEIVKPGLASKEMIEQATSFAFINGRVVTYNDEISISHPVEGLELQGAIKAEHLYQLLTKLKKDTIEVSVTENEVILSAGKIKAGLTLQSEIKLPLESISEIGKWKLLPDNFCKYLGFVLGSASKDMSKPKMTCAHVNQAGWIEASDGNRITKCIIEEMPVPTFLVPVSSCSTVVKLEPIKIAQGKGWVHFQTAEGTIISCRTFEEDTYPDTYNVFNVVGTELKLPSITQEVLDRAGVFAKREHISDEFVSITIEDRKFKIRSESDTGWLEEEVNIKYDGDPINFSVSPYLLKGILSETLHCIINKERMKFQGENWVYVTALKAIPKSKQK